MRAIASHRRETKHRAARCTFPLELHVKDAQEVIVFLCTDRRAPDILNGGWNTQLDICAIPNYLEFVAPDAAQKSEGTGVGLLACKAITQRIRIMRRNDGSFYTTGRKGLIPDDLATKWPSTSVVDTGPAHRSPLKQSIHGGTRRDYPPRRAQ